MCDSLGIINDSTSLAPGLEACNTKGREFDIPPNPWERDGAFGSSFVALEGRGSSMRARMVKELLRKGHGHPLG